MEDGSALPPDEDTPVPWEGLPAPPTIPLDGGTAPHAPDSLEATGIDPAVLEGLAVKLACGVPVLTSRWAADRLRLPLSLIDRIFYQLREDRLVEILGEDELQTYRYAATDRGREQGRRLLEISGYVGPAPVSLEAYTSFLQWQCARHPQPSLEEVREALREMVLTDQAVEVATLAARSGRSLFLFGPPGNGKTTLGRRLHATLRGDLWIPHCISIEGHVIRIFDRQCHRPADPEGGGRSPLDPTGTIGSEDVAVDRRWVHIQRPCVVAGGEMTLNELDLAYSPSLRFYEAPPHVKSNGGMFLLDDFGRQQVNPHDLLNRWIIPLEHHIDHLTLNTGQKIQMPFELLLIVATNLKVSDVADPAFLRRMGYRLHLGKPTAQEYAEIFRRRADAAGADARPEVIEGLLRRYQQEQRDLRACEPRDLIDRVTDICRLRGHPPILTDETIGVAWQAYFGETPANGI